MAEFKLGRIRFVWKGTWATTTVYYKDDVIRLGGRLYICITGHTSSANFDTDSANWETFSDGTTWRGPWTTSTYYGINDIVTYGGYLYIANAGHTSAATNALGLEDNQSDWDIFAEGFDWQNNWGTSTRYRINQLVKYGGAVYLCNTGHTSNADANLGLEADSASWDLLVEGQEWKSDWTISTKYKKYDIVKYGGTLYICNTGHVSAATDALGLEDDQAKWDIYQQAFIYLSNWLNNTRYKINDVVRYGGDLYICTQGHTSAAFLEDSVAGSLGQDSDKWEIFVPGLQWDDSWSPETVYQPGDLVTYGGYVYVSQTIHVGATPVSGSDWQVFTTGFKFRGEWGEDSTNQDYRIGDVVRRGGYTYIATVDNNNIPPPDVTAWDILNTGILWQGDWTNGAVYAAGDAVKYGNNSYICVDDHTSDNATNRPDVDINGDFWNLLAGGAESSALTTSGDLLYYGGAGPTRLPIGTIGQALTVNTNGNPEWTTFGTLNDVWYVALEGTDNPYPTNGGNLDRPWRTIKYACQQIDLGAKNPNAKRLLELNRQFIQREVVEWTDYQIANDILPFTSAFTYDSTKCYRDIGYIVDAMIYDVTHGGNKKTREAASSYINGPGQFYILGQEEETAASIEYAITVMSAVLNQTGPATNYQQTNSYTPEVLQITSGLPAESGTVTTVTSFTQNIADVVAAGTLVDLDDPIRVNTSIFVKTGTFLETLPIPVPELTAIVGDELRSTRIQPRGSTVASGDVTYSLAALAHLESIIGDVVQGNTVTAQTGNGESQVAGVDGVPYADATAATTLQNLVQQAQDYIDYRVNGVSGDSSAPAYGGLNNGTENQNHYNAARLIELNRTFLVEDVINYIAQTYVGYVYDTDQCRNDLNHYLTGFKWDLQYESNYRTLTAATAYMNAVEGSLEENMFLLRNGTGLRNCTVDGLTGTLSAPNAYGTRRPSAGAYASLDPGWGPDDERCWITTRSPYVQNVTTFGTGCIGLKVDGDLHNGGNDSIVANDFTHILSDGIGAWVTNLGRSELVSVFSYYAHVAYLAENGGKIRATNGNNSYGNYGSVAEGVDSTENPITASVNNRSLDAQISRVLVSGSEIIHLEYSNAGREYTTATYNFTGPGFGAAVSSANIENGGVFEVRLRNQADGSTVGDTFGGEGYISNANVGQSGDTTTLTLSATEAATAASYQGMRIVITAGTGVGQYGYIQSYDPATKVATIYKDSDGTPGWDTYRTGVAIESTLNATTQYIVEPRVTFAAPASGLYADTAKARARVASNKVVEILIIDPGNGYTSPPVCTVTDPNATLEVPIETRIGNGVLNQPTFSNRGTGYTTSASTVTGDGFADLFQSGSSIYVEGLTEEPNAGSNITFDSLPGQYYKIVTVRELVGSPDGFGGSIAPYSANLQISPDLGIEEAPNHGTNVTIRRRFSQVRLTGHDFLDIGTGNFANTNYPNLPLTDPDPTYEITESGGGRVFYTSTDQDGNFRVGGLFNIEQATGIATLDVDAFNLAGLQELTLGNIALGSTGATITEFSTDGTFTANSDNIVPTQAAIISYIASQIGGGASSLNVNSMTAGVVEISGQQITTTTGVPLNITSPVNFASSVRGTPVALSYYLR